MDVTENPDPSLSQREVLARMDRIEEQLRVHNEHHANQHETVSEEVEANPEEVKEEVTSSERPIEVVELDVAPIEETAEKEYQKTRRRF